jgi:hypothetical protein
MGIPDFMYPYDGGCAAEDPTPSEFSWGPGLVPKGCEHAPIECGGMYGGRAPGIGDMKGKVRYGYPGEQVRP